MQPNFFSTPVRTAEQLTCGIVNIPLTKPAQVYFRAKENVNEIYSVFESLKIPFYRVDNLFAGNSMFTSTDKLDSKTIKMIFRNFRTLRPKLISDWRYLFWEIDTQKQEVLEKVLAVYSRHNLPIYVHKSMRGYHFICLKPILFSDFEKAVNVLRSTNDSYPPICLRINPNKYIGEYLIFKEGFIISPTYHVDTQKIRELINSYNWEKIQENYQLVWYNIDKKKEIVEYD